MPLEGHASQLCLDRGRLSLHQNPNISVSLRSAPDCPVFWLGQYHGFTTAVPAQGQLENNQPWYNLARQDVQPLFQTCIKSRLRFGPDGAQLAVLQASSCQDFAWAGGSCLQLQGGQIPCAIRSCFRVEKLVQCEELR